MSVEPRTDHHGVPHFDPVALKAVIDAWNASSCDCCYPTGRGEGLDHALWYETDHLAAVREFAIELAAAAQETLRDRLRDEGVV